VLLAVAAGGIAWSAARLGAGVLWLWLATGSACLLTYLAAGEVAPLVGAAMVAGLARPLGVSWRVALGGLVLVVLLWARRRLSGPVLAAAWGSTACVAAAVTAWTVLNALFPDTVSPAWTRTAWSLVPGPWGLRVWALVVGLCAGVLVWRPSRRSVRESRRHPG
jgi:hypothetical protein